jgi:hypothetical protein
LADRTENGETEAEAVTPAGTSHERGLTSAFLALVFVAYIAVDAFAAISAHWTVVAGVEYSPD